MSIPYDTDDALPNHEGYVGMTEYERRSEKAKKELHDALELERSLKRQDSAAKSDDKADILHESIKALEGVESFDENAKKDWWTKTDHAALNDAPDKAIEEEANTKHIDKHYSYVPQFEVSGYIPAYMQKAASRGNVPPYGLSVVTPEA